jgi:hypothetical protein
LILKSINWEVSNWALSNTLVVEHVEVLLTLGTGAVIAASEALWLAGFASVVLVVVAIQAVDGTEVGGCLEVGGGTGGTRIGGSIFAGLAVGVAVGAAAEGVIVVVSSRAGVQADSLEEEVVGNAFGYLCGGVTSHGELGTLGALVLVLVVSI